MYSPNQIKYAIQFIVYTVAIQLLPFLDSKSVGSCFKTLELYLFQACCNLLDASCKKTHTQKALLVIIIVNFSFIHSLQAAAAVLSLQSSENGAFLLSKGAHCKFEDCSIGYTTLNLHFLPKQQYLTRSSFKSETYNHKSRHRISPCGVNRCMTTSVLKASTNNFLDCLNMNMFFLYLCRNLVHRKFNQKEVNALYDNIEL